MIWSRDPTASAGTPTRMRGGAQIAVAMAVMNVSTYAYTIVAARLLGPVQYGGFAAVMNLLLVVGVIALALQATAARRIAADRDRVAEIERGVLRVSWRAALAVGLLLVVLSPAVERLLRLESLFTALLVALTAVPMTVLGGQAGVLQGERRWGALGALYHAAGLPRLAIGVALIAWQPGEVTAVLGVTLGSIFPVLLGWWVLRQDRAAGSDDHRHRGRAILTESLANSQALLAFFALSNLDIVVARNALPAEDSGLYAGGLILAKAMLFLPQFVVVVAFPSLATTTQRASALFRSLGVIVGLGAAGTAGAWLLPQVALVFIGGDAFAETSEELWLFALLGTVLAMLQLLVYSVLARGARRSSLLVWAALVAMVVAGSTAGSLTGLVVRVLVVDGALLATLLVMSVRLARRDRADSGVEA